MPRSKTDYLTSELAMRALLIVQGKRNVLTRGEYVESLIEQLGVSRATAYRLSQSAEDVLGIVPIAEPQAKARRQQRAADGASMARNYR